MWYALTVAALSLIGAAVPLYRRPTHAQLQVYLSIAAGALLGAAMFHLLPESSHFIGSDFGWFATAGIVLVFLLQRYLAPHSHEPAPLEAHEHAGHEHSDHSHAAHGHADHDHAGHVHDQPAGPAAAKPHPKPAIASFVAIAALSVHSLFDGIAIGAATGAVDGGASSLSWAVFFSVLIHKPLDGLSVSMLMLNAGASRRTLWIVQIIYAALVPIGGFAFHIVQEAMQDAGPFIGHTLAFSAGTFLSIALTDLLPELHFHRHDRNKLTLAMLAGIIVMFATSLFGHDEHGHSHTPTPPGDGQRAAPHDEATHDGHDHAH